MINWGKNSPISLLACVAAFAVPLVAHAEDAAPSQSPAGGTQSSSSTSQGAAAPTGSAAAPASGSADAGSPAQQPAAGATDTSQPQAPASAAGTGAATGTNAGADKAREALKQNASDASSQKNLEQVFQSAEKTYSLLKAGGVDMYYGMTYSYFRNNQIDVALSSNTSEITQFQIVQDAQSTLTNDLSFDYGVWDNLTFNVDMPLVVEYDSAKSAETTGLGDVSFSARWQPFPLKRGLPTTTLFATFSTASGTSPYDVDVNRGLATGKGYYSLTGGASVSKIMDPVVLFASASYNLGTNISGLDQLRGSRYLNKVEPGDSMGLSMGLAYSLNYDISVSASIQMSAGLPTKYTFSDGTVVNSGDVITSVMNMGLSLRTSPKRIVNLNFGFGLTPDSPNLILGFNIPLDIEGFTTSP